jgi:catechol 2,3-dioxygenase-like lactoylglutathione lyase family enzyme
VRYSRGISYVEIGVTDMQRSVDFYRGLLGFGQLDDAPDEQTWLTAGPVPVKLVYAGPAGNLRGWESDDLQRGLRHVGLKVGDVDLQAERLRDAGVRFTLEPLDAVGDVRIAFFTDPDGALLEILEGHLRYSATWSQPLADRERAAAERRRREAGPVFDHIAVTVEDLDQTLARYRDGLGYEVIGQLDHAQDQRGFLITYLQAGDAVLEVFSYRAPKSPSPWGPEPDRTGHRGVGIGAGDPAGTADRLCAMGGTCVTAADGGQVLLDPDGIPLRLETAEASS